MKRWRTTDRLRVTVWKPSTRMPGSWDGFEEVWLPSGTMLNGPTSIGDKSAFFTLDDGREIDIRRDQDHAVKEIEQRG